MIEKVFWFAVGYFVARYIILNTPDYKTQEALKINDARNKLHDFIKKYVPEADDNEIAEEVLTILPEN